MKRLSIFLIAVLMLSAFSLGACSRKPTLTAEPAEDMRSMEITADKADAGDYLVTGMLKVGDEEQIIYDHQLEKGEIEIQFLPADEEQSIEELPDTEGDDDPAKKLELSEYGGGSTWFGSGTFMVKVTCTKKATGTVTLTVEPFGE